MQGKPRYEARLNKRGRWGAWDLNRNRWGTFNMSACESKNKEDCEALIHIFHKDLSSKRHEADQPIKEYLEKSTNYYKNVSR